MNGRLNPQRLIEVDNTLDTLTPFLDELVDRFAELLDTHELTAAHQAIFDVLDSGYTPAMAQWILTLAIGREALRRRADGRPVDPIQQAHAALWDSTIAAQRTTDVPVGAPTPRTAAQIAAIHGHNQIADPDATPMSGGQS